ncbi:hypothetical protein [Archangium primigenium]|uniref:hypothetical protein n=1 Tax=[Archangium] primigenium TaxID=2792470 RepID=UPI00195C9143|nr:hypothetical protein [Archangium primigenium]MBM7113657.1 hypothetical protein [Archangium primigenium]
MRPAPSLARRCAALGVLLLGSAALLATSPPDYWGQDAVLQGRTLWLDARAPEARRALRVVVTQPKEDEQEVEGWFRVDLSVRWLPPEGATTAARPWVRARLVRAGTPLEPEVLILEGTPGVGTLSVSTPLMFKPACVKQRRCEQSFQLELDWQGGPVGGVLAVDWPATAYVHGSEDELVMPEGLEVRLTEP